MSDDKDRPHNVTSYNQSGGITAHTVNVGTGRRKMDEGLRQQILTQIPRDKSIDVVSVMGDSEAFEFGLEINAFLHSNGFKVSHPTNISQAIFSGPVPPLSFDTSENKFIIGSNR